MELTSGPGSRDASVEADASYASVAPRSPQAPHRERSVQRSASASPHNISHTIAGCRFAADADANSVRNQSTSVKSLSPPPRYLASPFFLHYHPPAREDGQRKLCDCRRRELERAAGAERHLHPHRGQCRDQRRTKGRGPVRRGAEPQLQPHVHHVRVRAGAGCWCEGPRRPRQDAKLTPSLVHGSGLAYAILNSCKLFERLGKRLELTACVRRDGNGRFVERRPSEIGRAHV